MTKLVLGTGVVAADRIETDGLVLLVEGGVAYEFSPGQWRWLPGHRVLHVTYEAKSSGGFLREALP